MTLSLHDINFRSRALAQTHPFSRTAQAYLNATIARERAERPNPDISFWASQAITVGYCLRRIEEDDSGAVPTTDPSSSTENQTAALDEMTDDLVAKIQTDEFGDFLLYPQSLMIDALDRIIGGEIERRLADLAEKVDKEEFQELESYIGWWTLKGYCLRVAEQLVGAA